MKCFLEELCEPISWHMKCPRVQCPVDNYRSNYRDKHSKSLSDIQYLTSQSLPGSWFTYKARVFFRCLDLLIFVYRHACAPCVCLVCLEASEGHRIPWNSSAVDGCEPPGGFWETNPSPLRASALSHWVLCPDQSPPWEQWVRRHRINGSDSGSRWECGS